MSYAGSIAAANRIIESKGKSVTFTRTTGGTRDPATGAIAGGTTETMTIKAAVLPASGGKIQELDLRYGDSIDMSTIQKLQFLIVDGADCTFEPAQTQTVTVESEDWTVLGVTPVNPNVGTPIIYKIAIRI